MYIETNYLLFDIERASQAELLRQQILTQPQLMQQLSRVVQTLSYDVSICNQLYIV